MPKPKNRENKSLPSRWRLYHGAYYYRVPPGLEAMWDGKKQFRLGVTLPEATKAWAERVGAPRKIRTVNEMLDRYDLEVVPAKAAPTQANNRIGIKQLRGPFGKMAVGDVRPRHVYKFVAEATHKIAAHRAVEVLSHAYTKMVEWGEMDRHPFKGEVRLEGEAARTRYIEDWEIEEALALTPMRKRGSVLAVQAAIRIVMLTPLRRADYLQLEPKRDFKADGIHVTTQKTGKPVIYTWTPELRTAVEMALAARPVDIAPWLFCTRRGECYYQPETGDAPGWDSMVQRFMDRVIAETKVAQRFTMHDVRAKAGSDAESLERARALLAHADTRMTARGYRRAPEVVVPLSAKKTVA